MNKCLLTVCLGVALSMATAAQAADFNLINVDPTGVGLNDTAVATPVGGNPGKTRGQQATIVYRYAMDMWGGVLESSQVVNVQASFAPLACTTTSGTLASAGTTFVVTGSPDDRPNRAYGSALADAVFDLDLIAYFYGPDYEGYPDIASRFNGDLGKPGCLEGMSWYFGLDGKTPEGQVNFLNVVMHEIGHGLGVQGFINRTVTSSNFGANSYSAIDAYTANAYDNVINKPYAEMTSSERRTALLTPGRTVWTGLKANQTAALTLDNRNALKASAPAAIAGQNYEIGYAGFGPLALPPAFANKALVLINDGAGPSNTDGCDLNTASSPTSTFTYANKASVVGKIAVIDRGACSFAPKVKIAQDNGAVGVIIVNTGAGVIDMGNSAPPLTGITIPTVMVSLADGNQIKANITSARVAVAGSPFLAGADNMGRTRLYTPSTFAPGSSFSHFDTALMPDALMEPFDSPTVQAQISADLTPGLFSDIGWTLNPGNGKIGKCDTGVDAVADSGFVLGANVQAQSTVCKAQFPTSKLLYTKCMTDYGTSMRNRGLLSTTQHMKIVQCAALN